MVDLTPDGRIREKSPVVPVRSTIYDFDSIMHYASGANTGLDEKELTLNKAVLVEWKGAGTKGFIPPI